jgi:hypothetical protein
MTEHPRVETYEFRNPAISTAANDATYAAVEAPYAGSLSGASYTPEADITGANTNYRQLKIINKGADGNGTTEMADLSFTSGVNATDYNETAFTLSGTAANLDFVAGDIIAVQSNGVGTGLADPGGLVQLNLSRD